MIKKILSVILLFLVLPSASTTHAIITASLDKAINNIQSTYQGVSDLSASFTQKTHVAVLGKDITNSGSLRWKKPGKFFIEYSGEQPRQYISNNKKMWIYVPGDTQVEVYNVSDKTISKEALEFMRGFVNIKKFYNITGWKKRGGGADFTFVPLFQNAPYSMLKCRFGSDNLLYEVTIYNISGNISTYRFANVRINNGLPDNLFKFKKPKGVKSVTVR